MKARDSFWDTYGKNSRTEHLVNGALSQNVSMLTAAGYTQRGAEYLAGFLGYSSTAFAKSKAYKRAGKEFDEKNK